MSPSTPSQKTILITGCFPGSLGYAFALEFHRRGFAAIATARSVSSLTSLAVVGIRTLSLDVTSTTSIAALTSQVTDLDILFNNAGVTHGAALTDITPQQVRGLFETNVFGTVALTQALLPLLITSKGTIVMHTSTAAHILAVFVGAYGASKAALASLTNTLRVELAPLDVRVVELVSGAAPSQHTTVYNKLASIPPESLYAPVKSEIEPILQGTMLEGKMPSVEAYARVVVNEVVEGRKVWVWKGYFARVLWWMWWVDAHWKGIWDLVLGWGMSGDLLRERRRKMAAAEEEGKSEARRRLYGAKCCNRRTR
jgi:1-acylglycerone phosphate reductase